MNIQKSGKAKRAGTLDLGRLYEQKIPALISQRCINKGFNDFWLLSNAEGFGAFDDLLLYTQNHHKKTLFLIQLKHKNKPIISSAFESDTGDFGLKTYEHSFEQIMTFYNQLSGALENLHSGDVKFVIFTNAEVTGINRLQKIIMTPCSPYGELQILNTAKPHEICIFRVENKIPNAFNEKFLENLFIFTNQVNVEYLPTMINSEWEINVDKSVTEEYIKIFENWFYQTNKKKLKLYKSEIENRYFDILIKPHVQKPFTGEFKEEQKLNMLVQFINKFNITEIKENFSNSALWTAVQYVMKNKYDVHEDIVEKWTSRLQIPEIIKNLLKVKLPSVKDGNMSLSDIYLELCQKRLLPLLIKYEEATAKTINQIIERLRDVVKNRALVCINSTNVPTLSTKGLLRFQVSEDTLQDDLESFINNINIYVSTKRKLNGHLEYKSFMNDLTPDVLIHLFNEVLYVNPKKQNLEVYLERRITVPMIKENILKDKQYLLILFDSDINLLRTLPKSVDLKLYSDELNMFVGKIKTKKDLFTHQDINILRVSGNVSQELLKCVGNLETTFYEVSDSIKFQSVLLLKLHPLFALFQIIYSNGAIDKEYITEVSLLESELLHFTAAPTKIICNIAGMGKSTLLSNFVDITDPAVWPVLINLPEHGDFLDSKQNDCSDCIYHFFHHQIKNIPSMYHTLCRKIFENRLKNGNVVWYIDAFDEVQYRNIWTVMEIAKNIGIKIWVTTRPSKITELQKGLKCIPFTIHAFSKNDQYKFLKKYFAVEKPDFSDENIKEIVSFMENCSLDEELIGIPQQTLMFSQIFIVEGLNFLHNERITIQTLYDKFIQSKLINFEKWDEDTILLMLEKLSLTLFFTKEYLQQNNIINYDDFGLLIKSFKKNKHYLVTTINENNEPLFTHRTYAEFLTAKWLSNAITKEPNRDCYKTAVRTLFFEELRPVRYFFDLIMCKNLPLHTIVLMEDVRKIEQLLNNGYNINEMDELGRTSLHITSTYGQYCDIYCDDDILNVRFHLEHNKKDYPERHWNPMLRISVNNLEIKFTNIFEKNISKSRQIVKMLIENGIAIYQKDKEGFDAFQYCIKSGSLDVLDMLCDQKCINIDFSGYNLKILIYRAIEQNYNFLLTKILDWVSQDINNQEDASFSNEQKPNTKSSNKSLRTKLGGIFTFKKRITRVDLNELKSINGRSLVRIARQFKNTEACLILVQKKIFKIDEQSWINRYEYITPLKVACELADCNVVKKFRKLGKEFYINPRNKSADVNRVIDENGWTALFRACENGQVNVVTALVHAGADINHVIKNGKTALFVACENGHVNVVNTLIRMGVKVNQVDNLGETALFDACEWGRVDVMNELLKFGADVNHIDKEGQTPLSRIVWYNEDEVRNILIKARAKKDE